MEQTTRPGAGSYPGGTKIPVDRVVRHSRADVVLLPGRLGVVPGLRYGATWA